MTTHRLVLNVSIAALCVLLCGTNFGPQAARAAALQENAPPRSESAQRGEKLFTTNCAFCHGPTAKGTASGVSLIDSSLVRHDKDGDLIGPVVREGRPAKGMPAFSTFDSGQIADIVAFLHERVAVTDSTETSGPRGGYQLQHLLTGDAAAGKQYFEGAGGCAQCHSVHGDLAAITKKYRPAELETKFLYPGEKQVSATVTSPSGERVEGMLVYRDDFNIGLMDRQGHYHSWQLTAVKVAVNDPIEAHVTLLDRYTNKDVHDLFAYLETLR